MPRFPYQGQAEQRDLYADLGVSKEATSIEIRQAYRDLVLKVHPDKQGDAAEFRKVQEAYEVLHDPMKRQQYDANRKAHHNAWENVDSDGSDGDYFSYNNYNRAYNPFTDFTGRAQSHFRAHGASYEHDHDGYGSEEERPWESFKQQGDEEKARRRAAERAAQLKSQNIEREEEARDRVISKEDMMHDKLTSKLKKLKQTVSRNNCTCQGCRDRFVREHNEKEQKKKDPEGYAQRIAIREQIAARKEKEAAKKARQEAERLAKEQREAEEAATKKRKAQEEAAAEQAAREHLHRQIAEQEAIKRAKEQAAAEKIAHERKLQQLAEREAAEKEAKETAQREARETAEREAKAVVERQMPVSSLHKPNSSRVGSPRDEGDRRTKIYCKFGDRCKYLASGTCVYMHKGVPVASSISSGNDQIKPPGTPLFQATVEKEHEAIARGETIAITQQESEQHIVYNPKLQQQLSKLRAQKAALREVEEAVDLKIEQLLTNPQEHSMKQENLAHGPPNRLPWRARLRLSQDYIQATKARFVRMLLAEGKPIPAEGITVRLAWNSAGPARMCHFCEFKGLRFSFTCQGGAVACSRCKKSLGVVMHDHVVAVEHADHETEV